MKIRSAVLEVLMQTDSHGKANGCISLISERACNVWKPFYFQWMWQLSAQLVLHAVVQDSVPLYTPSRWLLILRLEQITINSALILHFASHHHVTINHRLHIAPSSLTVGCSFIQTSGVYGFLAMTTCHSNCSCAGDGREFASSCDKEVFLCLFFLLVFHKKCTRNFNWKFWTEKAT
jgi:hypothetical protein